MDRQRSTIRAAPNSLCSPDVERAIPADVRGLLAEMLQHAATPQGSAELLTLFMDDFLKQNGYHAIGDAVADTIEAAAALQSASRAEIATPRAAANSQAERGQA